MQSRTMSDHADDDTKKEALSTLFLDSDDEWKKSLRKIIPKFINYDAGNKQFLKVLDYENWKS